MDAKDITSIGAGVTGLVGSMFTPKDEENAYLQSKQDIANEYNRQAVEDVNPEARDIANEAIKVINSNEATKQQEANRLSNAGQMAEYAKAKQSDAVVKSKQIAQTQKAERDKVIIQAKEMASEQAKLKYEAAVSRYNQAFINFTNALKIFSTLL